MEALGHVSECGSLGKGLALYFQSPTCCCLLC